jgi:L-ascorbate metabolism protein UlaG (beta-lactamase superfamily)
MSQLPLRITSIGGPTALLEIGGLRLLTDPTFDPTGGEYTTGPAGPAIPVESLSLTLCCLATTIMPAISITWAASLSHEPQKVLTTKAGVERLGGNAVGLAPWETVGLPDQDGRVLRVTGTPARRGPEDGDRGPEARPSCVNESM